MLERKEGDNEQLLSPGILLHEIVRGAISRIYSGGG